MESTSIWTLKKKPMDEIASFILKNGSPALLAEMTHLTEPAFRALSKDVASEHLIRSIASMDDETYTDYLLSIIDE